MMKRVRDLRASDAIGNSNRTLFILMRAPKEEPIEGNPDGASWGMVASVCWMPVYCERHAGELAKVDPYEEISPTIYELEQDIAGCPDCTQPRFEDKRWANPDALVHVVNHEVPDADRANV